MIYISTQKGAGKAEGEDAVLVGREIFCETAVSLPAPEDGFICVADGVGGLRGGRTAAHHILSFLAGSGFMGGGLRELVAEANGSLKRLASETPELADMATTLSGIWYSGGERCLLHIGNTRVYAKQGKYLKQLTSDHTLYRRLMSMGRAEEAESCNKNVIIGCLGGNRSDLIAPLSVTELGAAGTILLTSDGVHEYVSIDLLEDILSGDGDGPDKCASIIEAAKKGGSKDDMTVVLADIPERQDVRMKKGGRGV